MIDSSLEKLRVLVVDDEPPARQRLIDLLIQDPRVTAILEAGDGVTAVERIETEAVDLVFLDIQMPELDGLGVLDAVGPDRMPLTIFVTAYDQHAIGAFEANALDYLLKPYSDQRMEAALERARSRLAERKAVQFGQSLLRMMASMPREQRYLDRLVLKSSGATHFVRVADVDWIEGAGVYVNL